MQISIAEVKRRLAVGTEYTGEFIGTNARICKPGMQVTRRRVVKNKTDVVSEFLDGPRMGEVVYLTWKGVTAQERDGSIILTMTETNPPEEFLKITIAGAA